MSDFERAAELLERGWCRLAGARDSKGRPCLVNADAASFCFLGALYSANPRKYHDNLQIARKVLGLNSLADWNDRRCRDQEEAVATMRRVGTEAAR